MDINQEVYFTIHLKDSPGVLARITSELMREEVDMEGIWGFGVGRGTADIIAVPRDVQKFKRVATERDWNITEGTCFRIDDVNRKGALFDILSKLAADGINLHAVDAMAVGDKFACYLWAKEEDNILIGELLGLRTPLI